MSVSQYQKVLSVAETILSKLDLPQETFDKYNEFKARVLEEPHADATGLLLALQADALALHTAFGKTCADLLALASDPRKSAEGLVARLQTFSEVFARKKATIREAANERQGECDIESRVALARLADSLLETEADFDRVVGGIGAMAEQLRDKEAESAHLLQTVERLREELQGKQTLARETQTLAHEFKALAAERDALQERLQKKEMELKRKFLENEEVERVLGLKIESIDHGHRQAMRSAQEYERAFERLLGFFRGRIPKDQTEVFRSRNLPAILDFVEDYVETTVERDKRLEAKVKEQEMAVDDLQSQASETDRTVSSYLGDIKQLVAASNACMQDLDAHAAALLRMRSSFVSPEASLHR